jgi:hypothetical protein
MTAPCLQVTEMSPPDVYRKLLQRLTTLPGVTLEPFNHPRYPAGTVALTLDERLARGQPEAFIEGTIFTVVRPDGSIELRLRPEWGDEVLQAGWGTIHPLARYMSGPVPPQSLIIYAPRSVEEVDVVVRIVLSAAWYARGEVHGIPLPDSRW